MNYIVIGTDCSGKSSLVSMLADTLDMSVKKGSSFELSSCSQDELFEKFMDMAWEDNTIFDRFSYCNAVYAELYKDYARLEDNQRRIIESEFMDNAKVIYLYADDDVLIKRFNDRGDDYVDIENLLQAKKLYESEIEKIKYLEVVKYDTGNLSTKEIVEDILLKH